MPEPVRSLITTDPYRKARLAKAGVIVLSSGCAMGFFI